MGCTISKATPSGDVEVQGCEREDYEKPKHKNTQLSPSAAELKQTKEENERLKEEIRSLQQAVICQQNHLQISAHNTAHEKEIAALKERIESLEITDAFSLDAVRKDIAALVNEKGCHPILVRLSWHDSGTWCEKTKTGGPRAVQCFEDAGEATYGCNAGLGIARKLLQPIKDKYGANISLADFWALAGVVAIEEAGGPKIPFRTGRVDATSSSESVPDGRLPDGDKGASHLRDIFHRMGFSDEDIVALSGAHTLGACHPDRSGFDGDWTENKLKFDNSYFVDLFEEKWEATTVKETGNPQLVNDKGKMMLTTDLCLTTDEKFRPHAEKYAKSQDAFFTDFAKAFQRLQELGYKGVDDKRIERAHCPMKG